ncbi:MAG: hypothetical protein RSB52_07180, partial [Acidaminococcaceae bacterium]
RLQLQHLEMYQTKSTPKGSISFSQTGQRLISLFETADQSTFLHEMSHLFLLDLEQMAGLAGGEHQLGRDYKTVMDWAGWKPGQVDEYKGTASAAEFYARDAAIQAAEKKGDRFC